MSIEVRVEKTPNGGVKSVILFFDDQGKECQRDQATRVVIQELNEQDEVIFETFGFATSVTRRSFNYFSA